MKAVGVCGMAVTGLYGLHREYVRVVQVEQVTTEPGFVRLSQDPLIKKWMRKMDWGPMHFQSMPAHFFVEKESGNKNKFGGAQYPKDLPDTVLDTQTPPSVLTNPWLALLVVPIPFMLAYEVGCMCVRAPRGCTHKALLQYVQFDPALQYYMDMYRRDPRTRFSDLFAIPKEVPLHPLDPKGEGPAGHPGITDCDCQGCLKIRKENEALRATMKF